MPEETVIENVRKKKNEVMESVRSATSSVRRTGQRTVDEVLGTLGLQNEGILSKVREKVENVREKVMKKEEAEKKTETKTTRPTKTPEKGTEEVGVTEPQKVIKYKQYFRV